MNFIFSSIILFSLWIVLSGKFDAFHIILGVISTVVVAAWTGDMLADPKSGFGFWGRVKIILKFIPFFIWLTVEIVKANIHVVLVAMHPNMKDIIAPKMIEFKTRLKSDAAKFALAQSITLTPGTVSVRIMEDTFLVHALTKKAAEGLPGAMEDKVAALFGETK